LWTSANIGLHWNDQDQWFGVWNFRRAPLPQNLAPLQNLLNAIDKVKKDFIQEGLVVPISEQQIVVPYMGPNFRTEPPPPVQPVVPPVENQKTNQPEDAEKCVVT